jgi:hypothetical protein
LKDKEEPNKIKALQKEILQQIAVKFKGLLVNILKNYMPIN